MSSLKSSLTEKLGLWYFKRINHDREIDFSQSDPTNLTEKERITVNKTLRKAIANAAICGLLSSFIAFLFAYYISDRIVYMDDFIKLKNISYLFAFLGVTIFLSLVEMVVIFIDTMNKSLKIIHVADRQLFPEEDPDMEFGRYITRAALELPNPRESDINIDPLKNSNKIKRFFKKIIYTAKSSITKLVLKSIIQRAVGKALSRVYFTVLSIPIVAFWNGFESYKILTEVKIRVIGPSVVNDYIRYYNEHAKSLSYKANLQVLRAVGVSVVIAQDLHPNLKLLYRQLVIASEINVRNATFDSPELFLKRFSDLSKKEIKITLKTLEFSTMLSGRLNYRQRKFLSEVFEQNGQEFDLEGMKTMRRKFKQGYTVI
ncbi:MAG: hypothetical protein U9N85_03755 [Bacteroidota bacterium]|nr:hypothetical protein [Bacteroidota bacterium]